MTTTEKEAFFAQYWGQKTGGNKYFPKGGIKISESSILNIDFLSLRSLDSITDEELKTFDYEPYDKDFWIENINSGVKILTQKGVDYLRSIGILIPFRNFSTSDIIESGAAKIRQ